MSFPDPGDRPVVAAFDFDGTLAEGGSVFKFLVALRGRKAVALATLALLPALVKAAVLGGSHADTGKEALFTRVLAGLDAGEAGRTAAAFGRSHYARRARPEISRRLEWHRDQGHRLVIVSASPELYLRPLAADLGVEEVIATRLAVDANGKLTGHYEGSNCRGAEKLARLRALLDNARAGDDPVPFLWAYGNSAGDRQLLAGADIGVDVGHLGRLGKLKDFPRLAEVPGPSGGGSG